MDIHKFWSAILEQDAQKIRKYFHQDAYVNWHCTNEHFNLEEFVIANCEYPGDWDGTIERVEIMNDLIITVVNVYPKSKNVSFHVTSFIKIAEDKVTAMDEYWADDSNVPQWRKDMHIGIAIK